MTCHGNAVEWISNTLNCISQASGLQQASLTWHQQAHMRIQRPPCRPQFPLPTTPSRWTSKWKQYSAVAHGTGCCVCFIVRGVWCPQQFLWFSYVHTGPKRFVNLVWQKSLPKWKCATSPMLCIVPRAWQCSTAVPFTKPECISELRQDNFLRKRKSKDVLIANLVLHLGGEYWSIMQCIRHNVPYGIVQPWRIPICSPSSS